MLAQQYSDDERTTFHYLKGIFNLVINTQMPHCHWPLCYRYFC